LDQTLKEMKNTEDISNVLRIAIERCYSMNRFITNFADVARIPEPQLREQNLNNLVVSGQRFMETICRNRNIRIILKLNEKTLEKPHSDIEQSKTEKPIIVKIDAILFEQVLINIIKNSAESIEQNGTIFIRTSNEPPCIEIADTGKGIDKETEDRLFTPFFSTKPHGQGLGLIFIREVLLRHDCTFSLRTYPDGLTRFLILW
jgi:signal transduction histidine kinase